MASEVDIVNTALSRLGDEATVSSIDPPEGSAQAEHAATFYPIARDTLLEMHNWRFATKRATLALTTAEPYEWTYAYALPSGMLKSLAVLPATGSAEDDGHDYDQQLDEDGNQIILTDLEDATLRYTAKVTDTTRFPPLFTDALGWLLASYLAGPILKGDAGKAEAKACLAHFRMAYSLAIESDANQRRVKPTHTPSWIGGR